MKYDPSIYAQNLIDNPKRLDELILRYEHLLAVVRAAERNISVTRGELIGVLGNLMSEEAIRKQLNWPNPLTSRSAKRDIERIQSEW